MSGGRVQRRLAAILAVDVAGYSRLMGEDEEGTLAALRAIRQELGEPKISEHRGRIVKTTGDGLLVDFASVVDAVRCAVEVQREMLARNASVPAERRIKFRMGINVGDIIIEEGDIFGDGVNIAARLEALAEPGGVCISAAAHEQVRDKLDFSFEDQGEQKVKNIARPVRVYQVAVAPHADRLSSAPLHPPDPARREAGTTRAATPGDATGQTMPAMPDGPSIAVLPFQNMSGDPEQEYFADGMVEEIITALSRIRWLFVIARNSSFTYKGQANDVKQVGRELGVRYVLEGSVRKGGNRVRITAQLIEAETGAHLWADRFDGLLEDVFDLQDQVAISVAGVIEPALQSAEIRQAISRPTTDLTAYDLYLRAYAMFLSPARDIPEVLRLIDRAIDRDPRYGPALAWAAVCHFNCDLNGWIEDLDTNRQKGLDRGRRGLLVAGDDPTIIANAAAALAHFGEDIEAMIAIADRALALNPSYARGWHCSALVRAMAGQADLAIEHAERAIRLSPRAKVGWSMGLIGTAHLISRRFVEAVPKFRQVIQEDPQFTYGYLCLASCYAHLGKLDEARAMIAQLRTVHPAKRSRGFAFSLRNPEHRELCRSGLRLAGLIDE